MSAPLIQDSRHTQRHDEQESLTAPDQPKPMTVSYLSLPRKRQIMVLMLARFTEPLTISSLQSYLFFQLKYFDPSASAATISAQAGLIFGLSTAAHICTGMLWARLADSAVGRRKTVLIISLLASAITILGYGFSTTFAWAVVWRMLDGALNNTISMVRCLTAQIQPDKRYRARALTLLPICANAGHLIGPLIGGFLVSAASRNDLGKTASSYPFAAPNIVVATIHGVVALGIYLVLEETVPENENVSKRDSRKPKQDQQNGIVSEQPSPTRSHADGSHDETTPLLAGAQQTEGLINPESSQQKVDVSFRRLWSLNVFNTMLALFIIHGHVGTFSSLWAIYLSTPRETVSQSTGPLDFYGGLGFRAQDVGTIMSLQAALGIIMQCLIYPTLDDRFGTIRVWRFGLCIFPAAYVLAPFCGVVGLQPAVLWTIMVLVLCLFVLGRISVSPATTLLINECTPHPEIRGMIHTLGTIVSSLSRSIFPPISFLVFGYGVSIGLSGLGFWFIGVLALTATWAGTYVTINNHET